MILGNNKNDFIEKVDSLTKRYSGILALDAVIMDIRGMEVSMGYWQETR